MNTALLSLALSSALLAPSWATSYSDAQSQAAAQKKPLVIVFGSGAKGWANVVREDGPTPQVSRLLAEHYVCVYVDTANAEGKTLAQTFAINGSVGMVISDRAGSVQAFWHQGDLSNQQMTQYLQKYADPQVAINGTETVNTFRNSFYPPQGSFAPAARPANC
jgi:hypothetical protein